MLPAVAVQGFPHFLELPASPFDTALLDGLAQDLRIFPVPVPQPHFL